MSIGKWENESLNKRPITTKAQLLVEGRTPEILFLALTQHLGLQDKVEVRTFGDKEKNTLQTYLEILTQKSAFKEKVAALGIIRDAESGAANGAFQSVCAAITAVRLNTPDTPASFSEGAPKTAIYILPDNRSSGMLENLILQAAQEADPDVLPCVERFFACVVGVNASYETTPKAKTAAYLLAKGVVDPQVGRGAQQNAIKWDAPAFQPLVSFIHELSRV
jgi:hypothetical protein